MGNCCSSKREENELDSDLNTLRPGDARLELAKDADGVNLDDMLDDDGTVEKA